MCLGLHQGSMSSAFNYYPLTRVGQGTWLGDEAYFLEDAKMELQYSIKCLSTVSVLEIGLSDFIDKMPPELMEELKIIALRKQFLKLVRMKEIVKTATDIKTRDELHKFH